MGSKHNLFWLLESDLFQAQLVNPCFTCSFSINPDELHVCRHHIASILQMRMLESSESESKDRVSFAMGPVRFLMMVSCLLPKC